MSKDKKENRLEEKKELQAMYQQMTSLPAWEHFKKNIIGGLIEKSSTIKSIQFTQPSASQGIVFRSDSDIAAQVKVTRAKYDCYKNILNMVDRILNCKGE